MSDFLQMNLNRMSGARNKAGQIADRRFSEKESAKDRLYDTLKTMGSKFYNTMEADKLADAKVTEADKLRGIRSDEYSQTRKDKIEADSLLAQARENELSQGHKDDMALQALRNKGVGAGSEDYDLYEVVNRAGQDLLRRVDEVWDESGKFIGWGAVDQTELEEMYKSVIGLSNLNDRDMQKAMQYFDDFIIGIAHGQITPEIIEEAEEAGEGGFFSSLFSGGDLFGGEGLLSGLSGMEGELREASSKTADEADYIAMVGNTPTIGMTRGGATTSAGREEFRTFAEAIPSLIASIDPDKTLDVDQYNSYVTASQDAEDGRMSLPALKEFYDLLKILGESATPTGLNVYGGL